MKTKILALARGLSDGPQGCGYGVVASARLENLRKNAQIDFSVSDLSIRSPFAEVGSLVYFGRMLDKIRAHAKEQLPRDYQANLGKGFDANCTRFLRVDYDQLVKRVKEGGTDEEILQWCFDGGRRPTEDEIYIWNEFMRKRGWNDEISEILDRRKKEAGMAGRSEIKTVFAFIDADEGRSLIGSQR
jgi:gluconokinase